jgi:hypothetical protein
MIARSFVDMKMRADYSDDNTSTTHAMRESLSMLLKTERSLTCKLICQQQKRPRLEFDPQGRPGGWFVLIMSLGPLSRFTLSRYLVVLIMI